MTIRTLDLFCGGGGSSWGARAAGATIVCGVDAWETATLTYEANFPGAKALNLRMSERTGADVLGRIGKIDLILASPECTNHTCAKGAGARDEASKRTALYVLRFAAKLKPRWIVLENVVHMKVWEGYDFLVSRLKRLGYKVRLQILDAADFGVPQSRRRLFIICDREQEPPEVKATARQKRNAKTIIQNARTWTSRPLKRPGRAANTRKRFKRGVDALGRGKPFLLVYYGSDGSGGWQTLDKPLRTLTTLDRFGLVTWSRGEPMLRMLQVPELRKAMGLPQAYKLPSGTRRDKLRILGNGVCPPVMKAIVSALTK